MENTSQQPVKFNMAIATLESMQKLLNYIDICSTNGDILGWENGLITLRRSISSFISESDFKNIENGFKELNKTNWKYRDDKNGKKLKVFPSQINRIDITLDVLTIFMRGSMNRAGLLMPKSDDPRFAIEG